MVKGQIIVVMLFMYVAMKYCQANRCFTSCLETEVEPRSHVPICLPSSVVGSKHSYFFNFLQKPKSGTVKLAW